MSKTKNVKKTLIISMFSMLSCVSMFAGVTYAWFTDDIKIENNHIVAGNLDVELYARINGEYKAVTEETNLFKKDALWEPGHVEVVNLKIANVGSLALQYALGINIVDEKPGVSVETNESFNLSNYIEYAILDEEKTFATRAEALTVASNASPKKLSQISYESNTYLLPKDENHPENVSEHYVTMIVYMPTSVGNEANHKTGTPAPTIQLGINLSAKQTSFEEDGFDDDYDYNISSFAAEIDGKYYATLDSAIKNAKDGETIRLMKNIKTYYMVYKPTIATKVTIDMNGHKISTPIPPEGKTYSDYVMYIMNGAETGLVDVTFKNGTFDCYRNGFYVDGGTKLTLDNVTLNAPGNETGSTVYGVHLPSKNKPIKENEVVIKNNTSIVAKDYGVACWGDESKITIDHSSVEAGWWAVYQNGGHSPVTVNVSSSTITGTNVGSAGIYLANSSSRKDADGNHILQTLNVEDSTIKGGSAIEIKYTDAVITNSSLVSTATEKSAKVNGSGTCTQGYSLAVTTTGVNERVLGTVTVDEATANSWNGAFVYNPDGDTTSVTINGVAVTDTMTYGE